MAMRPYTEADRQELEVRRAQGIFTDREEPRKAFWDRHSRLEAELGKGDVNIHVLNFYGIGGIGKTRLRKKLCEEIREIGEREAGGAVCYDFDSAGTDMETVLSALKSVLEQKSKTWEGGFKFPLFEAALFYYKMKVGQHEGQDNPTTTRSMLERYPLVELMAEIIGLVVPGADLAAKVAAKVDEKMRGLINSRKKELQDIAEADPMDLKARLPEYFGRDLTENMKERKKPLTVFLDTYEKLVDPLSRRATYADADVWLRSTAKLGGGVIVNTPGVLWVILGREKLRWEEINTNWEGSLETHNLGKLSQADAIDFLSRSGMEDETLRQGIYALTEGWPLYLDVCMDLYDALAKTGKPRLEDFGQDRGKLVNRLVKYMSHEQKECVLRLSCLDHWTDELAGRVVTDRLVYDEVKGMSFVVEEDGRYTMHSEVRKVIEKDCREDIRRETLELAEAYYGERLEQSDVEDETYVELLLGYTKCAIGRRGTLEELESFVDEKKIDDRLETLLGAWRAAPVLECVQIFLDHEQMQGKDSILAARLFSWRTRAHWLSGEYGEAVQWAERGRNLFQGLLGERHRGTLIAMNNLSISYSALGRFQEASELREKVLTLQTEILGERHPDTLAAMNNLASSYSDLGRFQEARKLQEKVLTLQTEVLGERHPGTLTAMNNLAIFYFDLGLLQEARKLWEKVLTLRTEILGERHPDTLTAMNNLAASYFALDRLQEARKLQEKVLTLRTEILGERHPDTLTAMNNLALSYFGLGQFQEARELREKVLTLRTEVLGERHPGTLTAMHNLAISYSDLGLLQEASELREKVLTLQTEILGERHPDTLAAMHDLAISYSGLGLLQEASELREKVLTLQTEILGERHPDTLAAVNNLASSYSDLGRFQEARKLQEKVLTLRTEILGERHPDTLTAMHNLAIFYFDLGLLQEARKLWEKVLTLRTEVLGERHPDTLAAMNDLAISYFDLGQLQEARKLAEKVLSLRTEVLGERHPDTLDAMNNLAIVYEKLGMQEEAARVWAELERRKGN